MPKKSASISRLRLARRALLKAVALFPALAPARADDLIPSAVTRPGAPSSLYGVPSRFENALRRILTPYFPGIAPATSASRSPLHLLEGIITPSGLHYERHHAGVPDIDPAQHRLLVHGLVKRPLEFTIEALLRYPRVSRLCFLECAGNSGANTAAVPPQTSADVIHGLISCSEWAGVPIRHILDEAGIDPRAKWIVAEGGDAASMERSLPLEPVYRQGMLALFQNGERLRPEQGYPLRLLMPGWEGNLNIKWLQRIKLVPAPVYAREETSKYTELQKNGIARAFDFIMPAKSVILRPSVGMKIPMPGYYQISGLAWSGHGRIRRVEVTVDGGRHWVKAKLAGRPLPQCLTRFRLDWDWDGKPALLQSRAIDEFGNTQPTRAAWMALFAPGQGYHQNAIQSWQVEEGGAVRNVYI